MSEQTSRGLIPFDPKWQRWLCRVCGHMGMRAQYNPPVVTDIFSDSLEVRCTMCCASNGLMEPATPHNADAPGVTP